MKSKKMFFVMLAMVFAIALFATACQTQEVNEPAAIVEHEIEVIEEFPTMIYINFRVYDPVYVALEKGFFQDHGLNVEISGGVVGGPNAIQAVSAGAAHAGISSIPAIINANAAGLPIQGVVDIQTSFENQSLQKWYTLADSDIVSMEDVCGRTYAVNIWRSSFHYTSLRGLDQRGIDPGCVNWVLLGFADQIPALIEGTVDIVGLVPPYQSYLEYEYGDLIKTVWTDAEDITGPSHVSLIFVNRIWAENNPEQAEAFTTGVSDAINWIEENQDEAATIIAEYTGIPDYAVGDYHFTENGSVHMQDIQGWMDFLTDYGDLTNEFVTPEMVATNEYNLNIP